VDRSQRADASRGGAPRSRLPVIIAGAADDENLCDELRPLSDAARRAADLTHRLPAFGRKDEALAAHVHVVSVLDG